MAIAMDMGAWHVPATGVNKPPASSTSQPVSLDSLLAGANIVGRGGSCGGGGGDGGGFTATDTIDGRRKRPWSCEDSDEILQLMMGQFEPSHPPHSHGVMKETLDLFEGSGSSRRPDSHDEIAISAAPPASSCRLLELEPEKALPCGWEKCLDLQTGSVYYVNAAHGEMTREDPRQSPSSSSGFAEAYHLRKTASLKEEASDFLKKRRLDGQPAKPTERVEPARDTVLKLQTISKKVKCEDLCLGMSTLTGSISRVKGPGKAYVVPEDQSNLELKLELPLFHKEEVNVKSERNQVVSIMEKPPCRMTTNSLNGCSSGINDSITAPWMRTLSPLHTLNHKPASSSKVSLGADFDDKIEANNITMSIVGCPSCLMYVMLSKLHPKCPKCGSSVLLDPKQ